MAKTICVDVDGTLARYEDWEGLDKIGDPLPGAKEFLERISKYGEVMIYSTRGSTYSNPGHTPDELLKILEGWLEKHKLKYDRIYVGHGKPHAAAYIDDRAVAVPKNPDWKKVGPAVERAVDNLFNRKK